RAGGPRLAPGVEFLQRDLRAQGIRRALRDGEPGARHAGEGPEAAGGVRAAPRPGQGVRRQPGGASRILLSPLAVVGPPSRSLPGGAARESRGCATEEGHSMTPQPDVLAERTIEQLVDGLRGIPGAVFTRDRVLREIGRTVLDPRSLGPYLFFRRSHYTRNLIFRNDLFEVVAIGWEPAQSSPIHNHRGQECWMGVPIGRLEVHKHRPLENDEAAH